MSLSSRPAVIAAAAVVTGVVYALVPRPAAPKPQREASPGRELTVLSVNAYLIPYFYVWKLILEGDKFAINSCKDQHARAKLLADLAKDHDVLALQEIWGGGTDVLQREVERTHWVLPEYRGWLGVAGTGLLGDYVNTLKAHLGELGGLWFATCAASTSVVWSLHHTFRHKLGEEFMNKSAAFMLLDVSRKWGPGRKLLVANTHLHSPEPFANTSDRQKQREEIAEILSALPSRLQSQGIQVDWALCGGLLVGDLNTAQCVAGDRQGKTPTEEYLKTLKMFDAIDLFLENDAFDPAEKGKFSYDGEANAYVSEVSRKDSSRMDYMLGLRSLGGVSLMKLRAKSCKILSELKPACSDHYPLSLTVVPME